MHQLHDWIHARTYTSRNVHVERPWRHFDRVRLQIMVHEVPLDELPSDLQFPDDLQGQLRYDAQRRRLCFDGFMSKATYDRLIRLSRDGPYHRAIDDLFRICVPDEDADSSNRKKLLWFVVAVIGMVATGCMAVFLTLANSDR